jgi:hypothetical protein
MAVVKPNKYDIGDVVVIEATFTVDGAETAPTSRECRIKKPDGTVISVTLMEVSPGVYEAEFSPLVAGSYKYRVTGFGAAAASEEHSFTVRSRQVGDPT